jgi:PKD repeat protein
VDQSSPALNSSISQWEWIFGDGDTLYNQNTTHVYDSAGTYQVLLTVTSPQGCIDSISKITTIYSLPNVNFSFTKPCTDQPIQFTDSSSSSNGSITNWFWNFGTGNDFSNQQNPTLSYSDAFAYSVTLSATSSLGCIDSSSEIVIINQSPEFVISAPDNCITNATQFQYIPNAGSSTFVGYLWQFGDGNTSTSLNPLHIYTANGTYTVKLIATNNCGMDTSTNTVVVVLSSISEICNSIE